MEDLSARLKRLRSQHDTRAEARLAEQQLDFWPDEKRAAPNAMVRCALFRGALASRGGSRRMHRETLVASLGGQEIYYSGEDLDQKDLDVWLAVLQRFREQRVGQVVQVSSNQLLKLAGLTNTGPSHKALEARLKRLAFSRIDIVPTDPSSKAVFFGALLQGAERSADGKVWELGLAPRLQALFNDGYTWLDWEIRRSLSRASLAQWLHGFYRSHREPLPFSVERLQELSGSGTQELRYFRNDLKKALARVEAQCARFGVTFEWAHVKQTDQIQVRWRTRETQKRLT